MIKRLLCLFLLLALTASAAPERTVTLSDEDIAIIDNSRAVIERAGQDALLEGDKVLPDGAREKPPITEADQAHDQWLLFVSTSLGEQTLRAIFREAADTGATVLFRGIPEGETLGQALRRIRRLLEGIEPVPEIRIDPAAFVLWRVTSVPQLVYLQNAEFTASVKGVYSREWLARQVAAGHTGDLGQRGPVELVAEPDLMAVLRKRAEALDLAAHKRVAIQRFWERQAFVELPAADTVRTRWVDPTVVLSRPLTDGKGKVLVPARTRINPLEVLPFTQTLMVFDARKAEQVAAIQAWLKQRAADKAYPRTTLITTGLNREQGWQALAQIESTLDHPVFLLNRSIQARFQLERTPTLVDAVGTRFRLREWPPEEFELDAP